jgi:hypothetical protein
MKILSGLKSIEDSSYRAFFKDGIWDLFWGLILLIAAVNKLFYTSGTERHWTLQLGIIWLIPLFFMGRIFITNPRLGKVKFGMERKKRKMKALIVAIVTQVLFGILFVMAVTNLPGKEWVGSVFTPMVEFLVLILVFSLIGYFIGYNRFYLIGFALALGWPMSIMINKTVPAPYLGVYILGITGLFITILGIINLILFLKRYPKQKISADYEK